MFFDTSEEKRKPEKPEAKPEPRQPAQPAQDVKRVYFPKTEQPKKVNIKLVVALFVALVAVGVIAYFFRGFFTGLVVKGEEFTYTVTINGKEIWNEEVKEVLEIIKQDGSKSASLTDDATVAYSTYDADFDQWTQKGAIKASKGDQVKEELMYFDEDGSGYVQVVIGGAVVLDDISHAYDGVKLEYTVEKSQEAQKSITYSATAKISGDEVHDVGAINNTLIPEKGQISDITYTVSDNNDQVEVWINGTHIFAKIVEVPSTPATTGQVVRTNLTDSTK
ncbi:MAG: hypothetical protein AABX59_00575 [Nanoarchaeota archaeon]